MNKRCLLTTQDVIERIEKAVKTCPDLKFCTIHAQHKGTEEMFDVLDVKINTDGANLYLCLVVNDIPY
jgi:hypothetical protein